MSETRDLMFKLRMTQSERDMLEAVAQHTGLAAADIIRQGIRKAFVEAFGALPSAGRKSAKKAQS